MSKAILPVLAALCLIAAGCGGPSVEVSTPEGKVSIDGKGASATSTTTTENGEKVTTKVETDEDGGATLTDSKGTNVAIGKGASTDPIKDLLYPGATESGGGGGFSGTTQEGGIASFQFTSTDEFSKVQSHYENLLKGGKSTTVANDGGETFTIGKEDGKVISTVVVQGKKDEPTTILISRVTKP